MCLIVSQDRRDYKPSKCASAGAQKANSTPHLAVNHISDAGLGVLPSFGPDQHVNVSHCRAGPQQLLQQNLQDE